MSVEEALNESFNELVRYGNGMLTYLHEMFYPDIKNIMNCNKYMEFVVV